MSQASGIVSQELIRTIRKQYLLPWDGIHGIGHWARVLETGLRLARQTGARADVVCFFAVFHDSRRQNEGHDPDHGRRGTDLAASLRGTAFELSDESFRLLSTACNQHTDGLITSEPTIQTCWDADRLDLGRVGIRPDRAYLGTAAAKDQATIEWAHERSIRYHVPEIVRVDWEVV